MNWIEVCVHATTEAVEPIANILHEHGAAGVAIEDPLEIMKERNSIFGEIYALNPADYPADGVYIKAYVPESDELENLVSSVRSKVTNLAGFGIDIGRADVTTNVIDEESWATAWKQYYKPIQVSERITIVPEWETYEPVKKDERIIRMDPGMAFGTGSHPTTMLSIQALDAYTKPGDTVVDVGCGSGVLSIAAALLGAEKILAFDIDDVAISSTNQNAALNGLDQVIEAKNNNLLKDVGIEADLIVSNILAEIIVQFIEDAWSSLKDGGLFITAGIIEERYEMVETALKEAGFLIVAVNRQEDWVSIIAQKPDRP